MPPVITVEHLRKVYGHHLIAVDDKGSIVALDPPRGFVVRYEPLEKVVFSAPNMDVAWLKGVPMRPATESPQAAFRAR